MPVNTPRSDYNAMTAKWSRVRDCYGGRDAVLKAGNKYVPDLPGVKEIEKNNAYRARGNFYNALTRTVQGMVGAIFQEAPEVEIPEKTYLDDMTLTNIPFEMFSQEVCREVVLTARYGVLIDMPAVESLNNRPYCVGYKAEDIINWTVQRINGVQTLTRVVLKECVYEPDPKDEYTSLEIEQYRVLTLVGGQCLVQLYRQDPNDKSKYLAYGVASIPMRRGQPLDFLPFVFICAENTTPEIEEPPLINLADVNLGHWRNSVDYEYGLHLVALPTPWVAGAKNSGEGSEPMKIGPSVVWELDLQGSAGMLEFSGEGLKAIESAMEEKKKQMAVLGSRMLEDSAQVQETASAVRMRHAGETASLRTIAQSLEVGFMLVLQIMTWWTTTADVPADTDVTVELNKEYLNVKASAQEITAALQALQAGKISFETWWNILMTGGWGREGIEASDEQDAIAEDKKKNPAPEVKPIAPGQPGGPPALKPGDPGYVEPPALGAAA